MSPSQPAAAAYSVVVVTWNCAAHLRALVASMNRHLDGSQELIVVDNASDDAPGEVAAGWKGPWRFIELGYNAGFGVASNAGVAEAGAAATVLLNPDTELLDDGLERLAAGALRERAILGPRVLNPDGTRQPSASGPPTGAWPWVRAVVPGALAPPPLRARTEPWRLGRPTRVSWLTGACIAAPRELLIGLGPFDESIHLYGEDLDLGLRAAAAGVESWFRPDLTRIVHLGGRSAAMRFDDGGAALRASIRRTVVRRAYGPGPERRAHAAQLLNLRLRVATKRLLGRGGGREWAELRAIAEAEPAGGPNWPG